MSKKVIYKYKQYIDVDNILINQEGEYRYSLFIPYKNPVNKKNVLVIMRNPSKANKDISDKTINNVLGFCHNKYDGVYMTNLYPYYETNSTKVKDFIESVSYEEQMEKNAQILDTLLESVDEVIAAWGTNNTGSKYDKGYEDVIGQILETLNKKNKDVYAMRFVASKNPWHPRNWEENFNLELYPLKK